MCICKEIAAPSTANNNIKSFREMYVRKGKAQKPTSVMLRGCGSVHGRGNVHIFGGHINAGGYMQVMEQHMLPSI